MKKVALSLIALLAAGTFAFAEDVANEKAVKNPVDVTLSAEGVAKFGFDLDTKVYGFDHDFSADVEVTIVPEGDSTKTGTGDIYGTITIADISVAVADDDAADDDTDLIEIGDVTAQIIFPNGYVTLYDGGAPGNADVDYSIDGSSDDGEALVLDDTFYTYLDIYGKSDAVEVSDDDDQEWQFNDIAALGSWEGAGLEIGYSLPSLVGFVFAVGSDNSWARDNGAAGENTKWEGSAEVSLLAVEKLTFSVKGYYGALNHDADEGEFTQSALGVSAAYDLGVVKPFTHINMIADETTDGAENGFWASDFGANLALVDGFDAVIAAKYDSASNADAIATFSLPKDKLVGPASAAFGVWLKGLTASADSDKETHVFAQVAYDLGGGVGVWGKTSYFMTGEDDSSMLFLKAGIDAAIFPLTTIGAEWDSNDFGAAESIQNDEGDVTPLGQIFVYAKVAY